MSLVYTTLVSVMKKSGFIVRGLLDSRGYLWITDMNSNVIFCLCNSQGMHPDMFPVSCVARANHTKLHNTDLEQICPLHGLNFSINRCQINRKIVYKI